MDSSLSISNAFYTMTYRIEDAGLTVKKEGKNSDSELHYAFEQIKNDRITQVEHHMAVLATAIGFTAIGILLFILDLKEGRDFSEGAIIWSSLSIILYTWYFFTRKKSLQLFITDSKPLDFTIQKGNLKEIQRFLEELIAKRNQFLVSKYATINRLLDYSNQLENLNWLLTNRAIAKATYDEKLNQLNTLFPQPTDKGPIGFSIR